MCMCIYVYVGVFLFLFCVFVVTTSLEFSFFISFYRVISSESTLLLSRRTFFEIGALYRFATFQWLANVILDDEQGNIARYCSCYYSFHYFVDNGV